MRECTCAVQPPTHEWAHGSAYGNAVRVDEFDDGTRFDPACPYHGEGGSMVAHVPAMTPTQESGDKG